MSAAPALKSKSWNFFNACRALVDIDRGLKSSESRVSGVIAVRLLQHILNETLAMPRKKLAQPPRYRPFTIGQLATACHCSKRFMSDCVADHLQRGLMEGFDQKEAKKRGFKGGHPQAKWFGVCPENWATAPKYEPPAPKLVVMPDPEPEPDEEPEANDRAVEVETRKPIVLDAGKKSRPVPWIPTAKKFAFDCSRVSVGLSISPVLNRGVVRFLISQQVAANTHEVDFMGVSPKSTAPGSRGEPPAMVRQNLIDELATRNLFIAPDHADRILAVLKGTPLPYFLKEVDEQRERARKKRKEFHKGLLLQAAADAAGSFPAYQRSQQHAGGTHEVRFTPKKPPAGESDGARRARRQAELRGWIPEGGRGA